MSTEAKRQPEIPLLIKTYDLVLWSCQHTARSCTLKGWHNTAQGRAAHPGSGRPSPLFHPVRVAQHSPGSHRAPWVTGDHRSPFSTL